MGMLMQSYGANLGEEDEGRRQEADDNERRRDWDTGRQAKVLGKEFCISHSSHTDLPVASANRPALFLCFQRLLLLLLLTRSVAYFYVTFA